MSASSALGRFFRSLDVECRDPWIGVISLMDEPLFARGVTRGYADDAACGVVVQKGGGERVEIGLRGPSADGWTHPLPGHRGVAFAVNQPQVVWTI
jgi:hypothetical protein